MRTKSIQKYNIVKYTPGHLLIGLISWGHLLGLNGITMSSNSKRFRIYTFYWVIAVLILNGSLILTYSIDKFQTDVPENTSGFSF